ncbi:MAG: hypothetical protein Q7U16_09000 [Agitococcus sp.]|nr:hypothetical protein [Agitococcus sp.]
MKPLHTAVVVFMGLVLVGCNENDHDSPLITKTMLKGVVIADGYLQGATVCLDNNNNLVCENTEPQDITNAQGQYTLNDVATSDSTNYAVITLVPAGAIIHTTTNQIVTKPYTLTTPLGKHGVISPITTFVAETMRANGNMDINTASQIVSYQLNVTDIDLFQDYSKDTTAIGKHLQRIALSSNFSFGLNQEKIEANKDSLPYLNTTLHTANITSKLYHIQYDIPFSIGFPLLYPKTTTIRFPLTSTLDILNRPYISASKKDLLNETTLYSFNCVKQNFCHSIHDDSLEINKINFETNSNDLLVSDNMQQYSLITRLTTTQPLTNKAYTLTKNGWTLSEQTKLFDNNREKTLLFKIDISGIPISSIKTLENQLINNQNSILGNNFLIDQNKKFPKNSFLYKLIRINVADEYYLISPNSSIFVDNMEVKTLDSFKNYFFENNNSFTGIDFGGLGLLINDPSVILHSVDFTPKLYANHTIGLTVTTKSDNAIQSVTKEENNGTWEETQINAVKLLTLKINSYIATNQPKQHQFYTEFNNTLAQGMLEATGFIREDILFNQTAMDAIKSAIEPKAIP